MSDVPPSPDSTGQNLTGQNLTGQTTANTAANLVEPQVTPLRCITGSLMAGVLTFGMYAMTHAIAQSFATHKIHSTNLTAQRLSSAVRTLVLGLTTLGTGVFGLAALGLLALAIQLLIRQFKQPPKTE